MVVTLLSIQYKNYRNTLQTKEMTDKRTCRNGRPSAVHLLAYIVRPLPPQVAVVPEGVGSPPRLSLHSPSSSSRCSVSSPSTQSKCAVIAAETSGQNPVPATLSSDQRALKTSLFSMSAM